MGGIKHINAGNIIALVGMIGRVTYSILSSSPNGFPWGLTIYGLIPYLLLMLIFNTNYFTKGKAALITAIVYFLLDITVNIHLLYFSRSGLDGMVLFFLPSLAILFIVVIMDGSRSNRNTR